MKFRIYSFPALLSHLNFLILFVLLCLLPSGCTLSPSLLVSLLGEVEREEEGGEEAGGICGHDRATEGSGPAGGAAQCKGTERY